MPEQAAPDQYRRMVGDEKADWSQLALMSERAKIKRASFLKFFWVAHVRDEFEVGSPFHSKAEFSCAVAVIDTIGGWEGGIEQEDQIGARFGANMWIYTKAVTWCLSIFLGL